MLEKVRSSKGDIGTPLEESGVLDHSATQRLHDLSITTVEELLGLIAADPDPLKEFLGGVDLAQVQADMVPRMSASIAAELLDFEGREYAGGALPPDGVEVEQRASLATFERFVAGTSSDYLDEPPSPGVHLDCFGPVRHQGSRSTCVAHAVCAVMECLHHQRSQDRIDLSEQFSYWDCKQNDGTPSAPGTFIDVAMNLATSDGVCLEETWLYNPTPIQGNEGQGPPPAAAPADAAGHKVTAPDKLNGRSSAAIRSTLDQGRPVAFSVPQYNNWAANPFANARGLIPMPLPNSAYTMGHAMCAIGYRHDSAYAGGGYLIVRNSWGAGWASLSALGPGHGALPFLYIDTYGWEAVSAT